LGTGLAIEIVRVLVMAKNCITALDKVVHTYVPLSPNTVQSRDALLLGW